MDFISTRGTVGKRGFIDTFLMGLADDGGLMIPSSIPKLPPQTLKQWEQLSYRELMLEIFSLFTNDEIPRDDLKQMIENSYAHFRHPEVAPVRQLNDSLYMLELFHGPTFAFKDVALQFLGELYSYVSKKQNKIIHILGATSGDTGAAAIAGVRSKEGIRICILHPHGKVSKVQELQMTTVNDENVLNLSVNGNFDDCQHIIKELFADLDFKNKHHLRAVNSINFVRILAQTVYYFYAFFQLSRTKPIDKINFSVPTGNFGNIFSGLLARKMGLPIHKLIIATNENNILERFIRDGVYEIGQFVSTHSPSMDIQIASNFERYLYDLTGESPEKTSFLMQKFQAEGRLEIDRETMNKVNSDFAARGINGEQCLQTIRKYMKEYGYLLDPHTACGVAAAEACVPSDEVCVALGTAHPAKFDEAIRVCGIDQPIPDKISQLFNKPQYQTIINHDRQEVATLLEKFYISP